MSYTSKRRLRSFAEGLLFGTGDRFGERVDVVQQVHEARGRTLCPRMLIRAGDLTRVLGSRVTEPTPAQLIRRLEHERKARLEAERIAESATSRLYSTMEELKSLNRALRDFVAVASHDLRTPITAVSGYAALLNEQWDSLSENDKRRFLATIDRSARSLESLIADLLTVSSVEADPGHVQRILVNCLNNAIKYGAPPIEIERGDGRALGGHPGP